MGLLEDLRYARDGLNKNESILLRELYPDSKLYAFGVSGTKNTRNLFYSMPHIMHMRTSVKFDGDTLESVLDGVPMEQIRRRGFG